MRELKNVSSTAVVSLHGGMINCCSLFPLVCSLTDLLMVFIPNHLNLMPFAKFIPDVTALNSVVIPGMNCIKTAAQAMNA